MNTNNKCIKQAENILKENPDDPKAYMWLALAYNKEENDNCTSKHPDVIQIDNDLHGELASTYSKQKFFQFNLIQNCNMLYGYLVRVG